MNIVTAATFGYGKRSTTGLDWYNVADPRPDSLPLPAQLPGRPNIRQEVLDQMRNDINLRQINWDKLYTTNYNSFDVVNNERYRR